MTTTPTAPVAQIDLLPCPFCGGTNIDPAEWSGNDGKSGPGCDDCGALAESAEDWNRRAGQQVGQQAGDAAGVKTWQERFAEAYATTKPEAYDPEQREPYLLAEIAGLRTQLSRAEELRSEVATMYQLLDDGEWAEHVARSLYGQHLETAITRLVNKLASARQDADRYRLAVEEGGRMHIDWSASKQEIDEQLDAARTQLTNTATGN